MPPVKPDGGLYFSAEYLQLARENQVDKDMRAAVELLDAQSHTPLEAAYLAALRYQYLNKESAATAAAQLLQRAELNPALARERGGCELLIGWLSVIAMLRRHPAWRTLQSQYEALYAAALSNMRETNAPLDALWRGALQLAVGIVFDQARPLENGAALYRHAVHKIIHPEGYLKGIADIPEASAGFAGQVSGTCALVLMAEMAAQKSLDLWSIANRGVTPVTASTYLLYYYFYPEKWIWSAGLTRGETEAVMRHNGAFIEMVNRRFPLRGVEYLLAELRPLYNPLAGGLTTLTHGAAPAAKPRWRLW